MFNHTKPVIVFDLETTGPDFIKDRIIELAAKKFNPDGSIEKYYSRFNPQRPIDPEATEKHGLTTADLLDEPLFLDKAKEILDFFIGTNADLAGYNINKFDIPFIVEEFLRAKLVYNIANVKVFDTFRVWTHFEPRTLTDAYKKFTGKELINAHSALADVDATAEIAIAQMSFFNIENFEKANDVSFYEKEKDRVDLAAKIIMVNGHETISFGKHKNVKFVEVLRNDPSYIEWCSNNENFPMQSRIAFRLLKNKYLAQINLVNEII
jgi:DNA polymerase-3 subunit epsilon